MNIMMKMDETNRLTEFIMNQEESLNAQEADFNSDNTFAKKWISELARETEEATKKTEDEARERQRKQEEINRLKIEEEFWNKKIAETKQEIENLKEYKRLFEELGSGKKDDDDNNDNESNNTKQSARQSRPSDAGDNFLITQQKAEQNDEEQIENPEEQNVEDEVDDDEDGEKAAAAEREKIFKKFRDPEEVFQLLNDAQSRSYFLTEHVQALEDEFEKEKKQREAQRAELEKLVKEGQENIQNKLALRKKEQMRQDKLNMLRAKDHVAALQLSDTGNINMKLIRNRIFEIYNKCLKTDKIDEKMYQEAPDLARDLEMIQNISVNQNDDVKVTVNLLRVIEKALTYYLVFKRSRISSDEVDEIKRMEREIEKENKKNKQISKRIEEEKKREESIKKNVERSMQPIKKRTGRKDMYRKPYGTEKLTNLAASVELKKEDDDEKFLKEDYDFQDFAEVVKSRTLQLKDMTKSLSLS